jgi:hypothetical protein
MRKLGKENASDFDAKRGNRSRIMPLCPDASREV